MTNRVFGGLWRELDPTLMQEVRDVATGVEATQHTAENSVPLHCLH